MKIINNQGSLNDYINAHDITLVTFTNEACNVCLSIYPDLEELDSKFENVHLAMVNTTEDSSFTGSHNIFVYPAIILYVQGKETKRFERVFSFQSIEETIERYNTLLND